MEGGPITGGRSVTLEPYRSMPVETFEQQGAPVQEVDIGQTEPSGSSDVAENTTTSEGDAKTNGATGGVLRVDEDLAATSTGNCYAYELDEKRYWITFNDSSILYIILPPKSKRERLRSHGTPAQIFGMKNCDTVDRTKTGGDVPPAERRGCASREDSFHWPGGGPCRKRGIGFGSEMPSPTERVGLGSTMTSSWSSTRGLPSSAA